MRTANKYHSSERDQCHHFFHELSPFLVLPFGLKHDSRLVRLKWGISLDIAHQMDTNGRFSLSYALFLRFSRHQHQGDAYRPKNASNTNAQEQPISTPATTASRERVRDVSRET